MQEITLGQGFGQLTFGMSRDEVKKLMGEPSEIEMIDGDEESGAMEAWHYDEEELSLSFEEDGEWKLLSITTASPDVMFEGIDLIGLSQGEVMEQMEVFNLGEFEMEDLSDDGSAKEMVATNNDFSLNLFFENDLLAEIQWGPFFDDEEGEVIWPEEE
ncbi:hypothetical protein [Carboxylicivirga linearis]|uniref:Beta-lactamase-inhibitor-like PepSY-like domain-containing protein n=1 Tax=Carboxylicivirga linearis TaxID=1628157 RepID=A0ABS5JXA1_9BACT|nr:hypothetical protein [Carboxylicivirga linearis]MBS2099454.1 hypothetical protein [Carboxylicivirga linearis]